MEARTQFPFNSQNVRNVKCFLDQKKYCTGPFKSQCYLILLERPHVRIASSNLKSRKLFSFSNISFFYYIPEGADAIYLGSVFGKIKGNLNRKLSLDRDCCIIKFASFVFIVKLLKQNSWVQSSNCTYLQPSHYWEYKAGEQNWANPLHRGLLSSQGAGGRLRNGKILSNCDSAKLWQTIAIYA